MTVSTALAALVYPKWARLESPSMTDEGGVLGNLPNTRPGRRSAKRDRPPKAAGAAGMRPGAGTPRGRTTAVKAEDSGDGVRVVHDMDAQRGHDRADTPGDAVGAVVRGAAGLAVTGVKVAGAVTQELFRRLPRP